VRIFGPLGIAPQSPGGQKPGFSLQSFCRRAAKRISAAIPGATRADYENMRAWASSNFAKQNCDQPLAPYGLSVNLFTQTDGLTGRGGWAMNHAFQIKK
jgi:hypothetical protein